MKILLINPHNYAFKGDSGINFNVNFPLGLAYVGAVAEKLGHTVKVIDMVAEGWQDQKDVGKRVRVGLSEEELKERVSKYKPELIGISNLFTVQAKSGHEVAEIVKSVDDSIITVMGGAHVTSMARETLENQSVDYIVTGEGEVGLTQLLEYLEGKRELISVEGIGYRNKNDEIILNKRSPYIENLDEIPWPARHLFNMKLYFGHKSSHGKRKHERFASIQTSRGCPAKCTFCNVWELNGRQYRFRSVEKIIDEIKYLVKEYGVKEILFEDDNLTSNRERAKKLFNALIDANLKIEWDTPNGVAVFALNTEILDLMKASGCYNVNVAVESADEYVLHHLIKKPVNLKKAALLIQHAKKIGLKCGSFFIFGYPGSTFKQMRKNFDFIKKYDIDGYNFSIASPYLGTELYNLCIEKGYLIDDYDPYEIYPGAAVIKTEEWTPEELINFIEKEKLLLTIHTYLTHPKMFVAKLMSLDFTAINRILKKCMKVFRLSQRSNG